MTTDGTPNEERLEQLDEHIREARAHASDILDEPDPDTPHFYESGEEGDELDDQQIAPPG